MNENLSPNSSSKPLKNPDALTIIDRTAGEARNMLANILNESLTPGSGASPAFPRYLITNNQEKLLYHKVTKFGVYFSGSLPWPCDYLVNVLSSIF